MFSALRRAVMYAALGVCLSPVAVAQTPNDKPGSIAAQHTRYIATVFPGRMTGSPAEMLAADYVNQQLTRLGYQSDIRRLDIHYPYRHAARRVDWQHVQGHMVIAGKKAASPYQIIVMAHLDTFAPQNDRDTNHNLGGLSYQGVDDNAAGVGVMLELAERLRDVPTGYTLRFIATSGEEEGRFGSTNYVEKMSAQERANTLLVINLDNLIVGDRLYFNSGKNTPAAVTKLTRDRALAIAARKGIRAAINPGLNPTYPKGTGCCNDADAFDNYGVPVLSVEATNWSLGKHDGYQQVTKSRAFPDGYAWHDPKLDSLAHLDKALPGRIEKRSRDVVNVLLPLITGLATAELQPEDTPIKGDRIPIGTVHPSPEQAARK
ncbi:aminopeptidase [Siccibacter turicensis]|uniref:Aminopeptidase n=1 Tax=Siccibacter turicensis TaxID=357233 RepID=A0A2P8VM72_9ENTR|nr:aminopeptidase [Siccibacter turicensis]PSN08649.1 aminopeptidase [Siccibacter turicensis]